MAKFNLDDYVPVNQRLQEFHAKYPTGRVTTEIIEHDRVDGFVMIKATAYRDEQNLSAATGHAFECRFEAGSFVNKTSYVENCETSAIGRALANLGFQIEKSIASRQEMEKVQRMENASGNQSASPNNAPPARQQSQSSSTKSATATGSNDAPSEKQLEYARKLLVQKGISEMDVALGCSSDRTEYLEQLTKAEMSVAINGLNKKPDAK